MTSSSYILLFIIGTIAGSFGNALIYRLPRGLEFVKGRSFCPNCGKNIVWYGLVPLISYIFLKGRCLNCKEKISLRYPLVETLSGLIFLFTPIYLSGLGSGGQVISGLYYSIVLWALLLLSVIDFEHFILPDGIMIFVVAISLVYIFGLINLLSISDPIQASIGFSGRIWGVLILGGVLSLIWLMSGGRALGLGDAKLISLLTLIFGFMGGLVIFFIAFAAGSVVGLALIAFKRAHRKSKMALGTFLSSAASVYFFLWNPINNYIGNLFLRAFT